MRLSRKQGLFISLLVFSIIIVGFYLFYYSQRRPRNLNIILITIDALRSDHLGCYGYKRNTSPNIDKLAKEGLLFTQAIAAGSHTPLSIGSILTATPPHIHLLFLWGHTLNPNIPTITEILKSRGYKTVMTPISQGSKWQKRFDPDNQQRHIPYPGQKENIIGRRAQLL